MHDICSFQEFTDHLHGYTLVYGNVSQVYVLDHRFIRLCKQDWKQDHVSAQQQYIRRCIIASTQCRQFPTCQEAQCTEKNRVSLKNKSQEVQFTDKKTCFTEELGKNYQLSLYKSIVL